MSVSHQTPMNNASASAGLEAGGFLGIKGCVG